MQKLVHDPHITFIFLKKEHEQYLVLPHKRKLTSEKKIKIEIWIYE